jgi:putative ABC transport system permease protein
MQMMFRLFRQVSLNHVRASWGRVTLVVGGIATGVALIVAINVLNTSVLATFKRTIETVAGPADLQVTLGFGEVGFDESVVEIVRADHDVRAAIPLVHGTISLADNPGETLQLFGADLMADDELERYHITTRDRRSVQDGIADPRSILVTAALASRHRNAVNGTVRLSTPDGIGEFTVRGLLDAQGMATAFGGQLAVMDLPAAQMALRKVGRVDQVDIVLRDGASVETVSQRLATALPESLDVARPAQRGEQYDKVLASFQTMLTGLSLLCLVAGIYIIYNTTSTGAVHRALVMAGLRLTGAAEDQLFRLLMIEAGILGIVGTLIGVPLGIGLAYLLTSVVSDSIGVILQLRPSIDTLTVDVPRQMFSGSLGLGAALFASYFAARRVTRMEPLAVMRADPASLALRTGVRWFVLGWVVLVGISAGALWLQIRFQSAAWGNFGATLWNASAAVIAVPLVSASAGLLSPMLARVFGTSGRVAAESLFRSPVRTGVTVAAVALVLTITITVASLSLSTKKSVSRYYGENGLFVGDLIVSAVATEGGWLETPLPRDVAMRILDIPGVRQADSVLVLPGHMWRDTRIALGGFSNGMLDPRRFGPEWYVAGHFEAASRALRAGQGVNVSIALADRFALELGDTIALNTPTGILRRPIVGIVHDYASDRGTVIMSRSLLATHWNEDRVSRISVAVDPGVSVEAIRHEIGARLGEDYRLKILLPGEMIKYHAAAVDRAFAVTDAITLLLAIVTIAGIFDLLLAAIWERRRELAVWRVIGAQETAVRRSVVIEAVTIGALGTCLGIAVGLVTAWIWVGINFRYLVGYYLEYHVALGALARSAGLVMCMTLLAGASAARHATRQSVLSGIQAE